MAFTPSQLRTISTILGVGPLALDEHLAFYVPDSDTETAVESELTRWATASTQFQSIEPKDRNFGVRYSPGEEKNDIRRNIAVLLEFDLSTVTAGQTRLVRA
jgi:hypothetical protein